MVFAWKHKIAPHQSVVETQPVQILEVELTRALPDIRRYNEKTGREYANAQVLVRLHEQPLGSVILDLSSGDITSTALAPQIWETFGDKINSHLLQDGLRAIHELDVDGLGDYTGAACLHERAQFLANAPFVSIVVATRDRPEILQDCLQSLLCLHYPCYEIVVVDNAPKRAQLRTLFLIHIETNSVSAMCAKIVQGCRGHVTGVF